MYIITMAAFKGGTAKSSASMHLASALSLFHNKRCLLIDFDPQANLSSSLGFSTDDLLTMVPVLQEEKTIEAVIKSTCVPNLYIVTANTYLDQIESTAPLFSDPYSHERLRNSLNIISHQFDFCFIDIPPSLNWLCRSAFYAANYSLICAIPEPFSILAMQRLAKYHESIKRNHPIHVLGVLLSFWDGRSNTNAALLQGIEQSFQGKTFNTKIRRDKAIPKAVFDGKPVFMTEKASRAAEDYQKLAQEFLKKFQA
jgi:chromosome partitioning protein